MDLAPDGLPVLFGGRYERGGLLGRGGMARVYRATDQRLGREVALKVLDGRIADQPDARVRLQREARALADLDDPNIVRVFDVGEEAGLPFLVMELVEGPSLRARLQSGKLPAEVVAEIGAGVAHALTVAHARGLVHRDVKPENLLLAGSGGVKVVDFGVARALEGGTAVTTAGIAVGTIGYLAPEVLKGAPPSTEADLYALGVSLWQAVTGAPPSPERPDLEGRPLPEGLGDLIRDLLSEDPAERPDAAEAERRLRALADGDLEGAAARPKAPAPAPVPSTDEGPSPAAAGATVPSSPPPPRAPASTTDEGPRPGRGRSRLAWALGGGGAALAALAAVLVVVAAGGGDGKEPDADSPPVGTATTQPTTPPRVVPPATTAPTVPTSPPPTAPPSPSPAPPTGGPRPNDPSPPYVPANLDRALQVLLFTANQGEFGRDAPSIVERTERFQRSFAQGFPSVAEAHDLRAVIREVLGRGGLGRDGRFALQRALEELDGFLAAHAPDPAPAAPEPDEEPDSNEPQPTKTITAPG